MKGIIDRLEGELAVILIEAENREILVPASELPAECVVKSVVNIEESKQNKYPKITLDATTNQKREQKSSNLRQALLNRKNQSKLKRKK